MSISCDCDWDNEDGQTVVGEPRFVTCRTSNECKSCSRPIEINDGMWIWNMYDWGKYQTASPAYLCEQCGDLAVTLGEAGFCFSVSDIQGQWRKYLEEINKRR